MAMAITTFTADAPIAARMSRYNRITGIEIHDSTDALFAPASLIRSFQIDADAPFVPTPDGVPPRARTLNLTPTGSWAGVTRMHATVDPTTKEVVRITILATSGDRTTYDIRDSRFDVPTPPGAFSLPRPEGSELISN